MDQVLFEHQKILANPKTEVVNIYKLDGDLHWTIGFYIPRFKFLQSFMTTWQFWQNGGVRLYGEKIKLSHYRLAMVGMKKQLEEWIKIIDIAIEKNGDIEPDENSNI